jgi:DNA-binding NtrC family response regulator
MTEPHNDNPFSILLVDDDHDVLAANARFLRLNQFDVLVSDSGQQALKRVKEEPVDAIVTDLKMPHTNGLEFAAAARLIKPLVPIVFFSAFAKVPDVVSAMRLGAVDFLEKPVDPEEILSTVQTLRDRYSGAFNPLELVPGIDEGDLPFRFRVLAYEKLLIEQSLAQHDGQIRDVLQALQINRRTLNDKMRRLGIDRQTFG